jgi:hypothetical protein
MEYYVFIFLEKLYPQKKKSFLFTNEPAMPVLYDVKLPVETASV